MEQTVVWLEEGTIASGCSYTMHEEFETHLEDCEFTDVFETRPIYTFSYFWH